MDKQSTNGRRLLAVFAHPDDESFGPGGTLAHYAAAGAEVHLVCATHGEVGVIPPEMLKGFDDAAALREHELRCAAEHLGLAGVHFMGYRDSGMPGTADNHHPRALAAADPEEVSGKILAYLQELKPQVVITFDPIGGYRHPDHIAMHKATLAAFEIARQSADGYRPQKLYYHTFSKRWLRFFLRLLPLLGQDPHHYGRNNDIDLTELAEVDFPIHARISYSEVAERKEKASACHQSQQDSGPTGLVGTLLRRFNGPETFMRAYPPASPGLREHDLFKGVDFART
jgi:LmbE family N-acetylglucosaminyl deacetylase